DQIFSSVTSAQLPVVEGEEKFYWIETHPMGKIASAQNQQLVMFNKGESTSDYGGFFVCDKCGKAALANQASSGLHDRDYEVEIYPGKPYTNRCNGNFRNVFLGYNFRSDILLFRIQLTSPFL